jgi:hypothetical protein
VELLATPAPLLAPPLDIEGGGPNPPFGEGFFQHIVNVHWPRPAIVGGLVDGIFVVCNFDGIPYVNNFKTPLSLAFGNAVGVEVRDWQIGSRIVSENGIIFAGSFAYPGNDGAPVFLLGGSDEMRDFPNYYSAIYFSSDGLGWSKVWQDPEVTPDTGVDRWQNQITSMVWKPDTGRFYANNLQMHQHFVNDPTFGQYMDYEEWNNVLMQSVDDGVNWDELERQTIYHWTTAPPDFTHVVHVDRTGEYGISPIVPYCTNTAYDPLGCPLPDGFAGYWERAGQTGIAESVLAVPITPPHVGNADGIGEYPSTNHGPNSVDLTIMYNPEKIIDFTADVGFPVNVANCASAVLLAAGGNAGTPFMAMSFDQGKTWVTTSPAGTSPICVAIGGMLYAPPEV